MLAAMKYDIWTLEGAIRRDDKRVQVVVNAPTNVMGYYQGPFPLFAQEVARTGHTSQTSMMRTTSVSPCCLL